MQYRCAKFTATRYLQSAGERNVGSFQYEPAVDLSIGERLFLAESRQVRLRPI